MDPAKLVVGYDLPYFPAKEIATAVEKLSAFNGFFRRPAGDDQLEERATVVPATGLTGRRDVMLGPRTSLGMTHPVSAE